MYMYLSICAIGRGPEAGKRPGVLMVRICCSWNQHSQSRDMCVLERSGKWHSPATHMHVPPFPPQLRRGVVWLVPIVVQCKHSAFSLTSRSPRCEGGDSWQPSFAPCPPPSPPNSASNGKRHVRQPSIIRGANPSRSFRRKDMAATPRPCMGWGLRRYACSDVRPRPAHPPTSLPPRRIVGTNHPGEGPNGAPKSPLQGSAIAM